ncbi:MRC1: Macrophage mannose receptor 1 [Crotalus adamanteus]|uniref:MRC1: Macrophage mannose receptor 1 n=1 Tax=Crotalus adamanteus TaxID=8729 RepID=A0AAW1B3T0_CROAD
MSGENGYWADHFCEEELGYICKIEASEFLPGTDETPDTKCQKDWKRYGFYCYLIGKTPGTFSEAKTSCETNQGFLSSVENRFEQAFLTSQIGYRPEKYFWIDLSDVGNPGTFNWTNGDPIQFSHWNAKMPGPNPGCVAMRTGDAAGLWDVVNCEERAPFLCKQLAEGAYPEKKTEKKNWYDAYDHCKLIGGHLASFHNKQEFHLLNKISQSQSSWLGLRIVDSSPGYTWIDGSPVNYEPIFPWHSESESERCTIIWGSTRYWSARKCWQLNYWICQITKGTTLNTEPVDDFARSYKKVEDGWIEFENNEYYFSNTTMPAEKAQTFCKQHGGDLTTIESSKENQFLWKYIFHYGITYYNSYIGLILGLDKKFSWLDGTPVTYEAWSSGESNFANDDENCCFQIFGFREEEKKNWSVARDHCKTLEGNLASIPNKAVQASHFINYGNSSYSMVSPKMTWEEARKKCESENSKLASIVDPYAESFIWLQVLKYKEPVWIGLSSKESNGVYKWVSNWRLAYTNWAAEEPMHKTACVYLDINGYWKTGNCSDKYFSVCERYNGIVPTEKPQSAGKCQTSQNRHEPWIPFGDHCYKFYLSREPWSSANLKCTQTGEWLWQDKSEVAFVNWNNQDDGQYDKKEAFGSRCVYMNTKTGFWFPENCHYYPSKSFICKINKIIDESAVKPTEISVQKGVAPRTAHDIAMVVVVPIIFIAIGAGIAAYIFYRRRSRPQKVSAGFDNSLYSDNVVILHKDSQSPVDKQELNEQI